jgi:uncharacterized protein (DUF4415 family)
MEREPQAPYTQDDWDEVSDSPRVTAADMKRARSLAEAFPGLAEAVERRRGRPKADVTKAQVTLRLDRDVIEGYRGHGAGWQTRMNDVLRAGLQKPAKHTPMASEKVPLPRRGSKAR